jgi:integrase
MTVAQLCDHFQQRELAKENTWRSHATKRVYQAFLTRWVRPHWPSAITQKRPVIIT